MTLWLYVCFKVDQQISFSNSVGVPAGGELGVSGAHTEAMSAGTASAGSAGQVILEMSFGVLYRILLQKTNTLTL